ncbi:MAG: diguanylate cyclase [Clostridium sp.]|nr:diguanylate cyclase [Clostridium sp.]MCM1399039.1 diguanylate cyclase [Clostridium sp.]MCM1459431.1 diguanylate cyclase [Bacteroides sp.]
MYQTFLTLQYIGIFILAMELIYTHFQNTSKIQNSLMMMEISLLLNFVGYLFELKAKNLEDALMAVKISYLGKPLILLFMFLFVLEYCHVKLPKLLEIVIILYHASVIVMVNTCENHELFYNNISFVDEGVFPHIVFGHGFFYIINTLVIFFYSAFIFYICIKKLCTIENKNEKMQIWLIMLMVVLPLIGLVLFFSGVCKGYDCTLFGYLFATLIQLVLMIRYHLFDTVTLAKEQAIDNLKDGIVVFNNNDMMLYLNRQAKSLIPETEEKNVSTREDIPRINTLLENEEMLFHDEKVYALDDRQIDKRGENYGHMYILNDITDSYNYTNLLHKKAYVDVNTGAKNRTCFEEDIQKLDERLAEETDKTLEIGVIVCDLNGLKHTNDTYGHAVGDQMIATAAKIMQTEMTGAKDVYRTGGDEFVVLYVGENCSKMQEDIRKVEQVCEEESKKYNFPLSIAMGHTLNQKGEKLEEIHKRADDAMYVRKMEMKKENPALVR